MYEFTMHEGSYHLKLKHSLWNFCFLSLCYSTRVFLYLSRGVICFDFKILLAVNTEIEKHK